MSRHLAALVAVLLLASGPLATSHVAADAVGPGAVGGSDPEGVVAAVYPNPVADRDAGEFVVLDLDTPGPWVLTDGEDRVVVPGPGRIAVTADPAALVNRTGEAPLSNATVVAGDITLSNAGERLELRAGGAVVDRVTYTRAPEGERLVATGNAHRWRPLGYRPRDPVTVDAVNATAFVLPDDHALVHETLRGAEERVLLAGYTFSSRRVADALLAAAARGVTVRVLVDDAPVGGLSRRSAALLDRLAAAGVRVDVVGGNRARFRFHHAKYAVVDDRAVVLSENWKPAGVGGNGSRGWGVRLEDPEATAELAALFARDAAAPGVTSWERFRGGRRFTDGPPTANASYPRAFSPESVHADEVTLATAPGNADSVVTERIDGASERVLVVQPTLGSPAHPFVRAALRAARRGVEVRVLLSSAWYVSRENRALAERLNERAERESIPLTVRVADPRGRFEKIHAKGVVVDDAVVVGSLNWNDNSVSENREVVAVVDSPAAAAYFARTFEADWGRTGGELPVTLALAVVAAVAGAVLVARRRLSFAPDTPPGP